MPPVGFETTILVSERPKTHSSDRTATGIGIISEYRSKMKLLRRELSRHHLHY
jgi:hypothetical protein